MLKSLFAGMMLSIATAKRVAEGATFAHPVPTQLGIVVRDENGLSLYDRASGAAALASQP